MTTTDGMVEAVREAVADVAPTLRANGAEAEERRWIPDENVDLLEKAGVFRMSVPRRFGGLDLPLADQSAVLTEIARADSATGWVAMIWTSSAWIPTLFPDRTQEEVYAHGSVRISTGFTPTGTLTPTGDGYVLRGTWKWLSGCRGAHWAILAAIQTLEDGTPAPLAALVPVAELTILDDWHTSAAAGTGSSSVTASDVQVPAHRVVNLGEALTGTTGDRTNTGATGRNYAFIPLIMAFGSAAYIGIARGAFDLFLERLPGRGITYTSWTDQSASPVTQIQVATAANKISAAEGLLADVTRLVQAHADAGDQPSMDERAAARGRAGYAITLAAEAVDILHTASSASVIMRDVPFQRFHRDMKGLSLHALFASNTNQEVHGRALVGMAPDTPFL